MVSLCIEENLTFFYTETYINTIIGINFQNIYFFSVKQQKHVMALAHVNVRVKMTTLPQSVV